ncbi:MAG TPA: DUF4184 family protein [Steroidobacteraceae bacterium]|nr:DUF4184 family protein [Steroidobacteraceae bacterium]
MPYTISHAAAVLPFGRWLARWRILSATVIGSLVPDLGYLMPVYPPRFLTHSALSLITFSLPFGLLLYWVFQRVMKTPLLSLLPDQAYMRWRPFATPASLSNPRHWAAAALGVLVGAITHLAWDAFTHEEGRGMRMLPELDDWAVAVHGHHLIGARLLQGISSILGLAIVALILIYALRRGTPQAAGPRALSETQRRGWVVAFVLLAVVLTAGLDILVSDEGVPWISLRGHTHSLAVSILRGLALALLIISGLLRRYLRYRGSGNASTSAV